MALVKERRLELPHELDAALRLQRFLTSVLNMEFRRSQIRILARQSPPRLSIRESRANRRTF